MKIDTVTANPDHKPIPIVIEVQSITTHTEATPDHTIGSTKDTTEVADNAHTPPLTIIDPAMTHHITDHLHIEALVLTPEITVCHALIQPTHPLEEIHTDLLHAPANHKAKCISLGNPE